MEDLEQKDWAAKWAVYSPDKIAVKEAETERTLTYGQLHQQGNALAFFFQKKLNLKKGDRVVILAENCLEYILLFTVAQKTGIILVPLNYRLVSSEINFLLEDASPDLILFEKKYEACVKTTEYFSKCPHRFDIASILTMIEKSDTPGLTKSFSNNLIEDDDPLFILYTSGTTGFPKGAIYTHKMLFWNSINTSLSLIINSESRTINVMPPFHTGGWNVLTTPFLHHGGYTCILKKFKPEVVLNLLEKEKVTIFMGVPTMLKMIAELPAFQNAIFEKLLYIIVGGEPMPIPLIEKWHDKNVPIRQGYGMTEVGPNLTSLHQNDAIRKKGSIGRPNFYVKTKIVNEQNEAVKINEAGELLLQGPMVTTGYWQNPQATQKAIREGWFHTGDLVREDEEGYLYVVDRIKNMFISGGENIYPAEVEKVLLQNPFVAEVAIIGVFDERWGEVGKAFIVLEKNTTITPAALTQFCQTKLAKFKIPSHFVFLNELPKNDTGKINRKALT